MATTGCKKVGNGLSAGIVVYHRPMTVIYPVLMVHHAGGQENFFWLLSWMFHSMPVCIPTSMRHASHSGERTTFMGDLIFNVFKVDIKKLAQTLR